VGTKLPSTAASGDYDGGSDSSVAAWHQEKEAWNRDRAVQGNKTATVLRTTEAGGDGAAWHDPTYTSVSGLTDLDVFVDTDMKRYERKWGGIATEADRVFVFYDVTGAVVKQDLIEHDGDRYAVLEIDFEPQSGRVEVLAKHEREDV